MSSERVKLANYTYPHEAELARLELESHGIHAEVRGEIAAGLIPQISENAIQIYVDAEDAKEAADILNGLVQELGDAYRTAASTSDVDPEPTDAYPADRDARRVFRVAIVGLMCCPGVLHLWAIASARDIVRAELSRSGARQLTWALALSWGAIVALLVGLIARQLGWVQPGFYDQFG